MKPQKVQENKEHVHDLLGYDGLKIVQRGDMLRFSLDSTLLADFVNVTSKVKRIIDFGTGNAPIPLFLSLKTKAEIIGVEIQEEVSLLAKKSVKINELEHQIKVLHKDVRGLYREYPNGYFDIVTCNPPFFKYKETSNVNKYEYRTIARHEVLLTLDNIMFEAKRLLKTRGSLYLVHRTDRLIEIIDKLLEHGFSVKRMRFVYPRKGQPSNTVLIEASNNANSALKLLEPLYVHNEDGYTDEIKSIFGYGKEEIQ